MLIASRPRKFFVVSDLRYALDVLANALRGVFLGLAAAVAVVCLLDWLVRTRRVNPFGGLAGFVRSSIRPLLYPVEHRLLRAGINPQAAPLWTLGFVVLSGIVVLGLLDFVRDEVVIVSTLVAQGGRGVMQLALSLTFGVLRLALIVRVLLSWLRPSPFAWYVRWSAALTEWYLRPLRNALPRFGAVDLSPLFAYILLGLVQAFLMRLV